MKLKISVAVVALLVAGCSSMTQKKETQTNYWIYDIQSDKSASDVGTSVTEALQSQLSSVRVNRQIPPSPLPEKSGRFQMNNTLATTNMGAMMMSNGISVDFPTCEGAIMSGGSQDSGMTNWGDDTNWTFCLWQYKSGYHLDLIVRTSITSGGFDSKSIAKALVKPLAGDSNKTILTQIDKITARMKSSGINPVLAEKYP